MIFLSIRNLEQILILDDFLEEMLKKMQIQNKETLNEAQSYTDAKENKSSYQTTADNVPRHTSIKYQYNHNRYERIEDKKRWKIPNRHYDNLLLILLSRSIQHERNLISQCLKYILDNNFFLSRSSLKYRNY